MIDVVFQLIIFFMFTSRLGELTRTEIDLPRESGEAEPTRRTASLVIDMRLNGEYVVESRPVSLDEISRLIRAEIDRMGGAAEVLVEVRPDRNARASHLNLLTTRLAEIGVRRWRMGTIEPSASGDGS